MAAYSLLFKLTHWIKLSAIPALMWAFLRRPRVYGVAAIVVVAFVAFLAPIGIIAPRVYAPVDPLTSLVIGAFGVWLARTSMGSAPPSSGRPAPFAPRMTALAELGESFAGRTFSAKPARPGGARGV